MLTLQYLLLASSALACAQPTSRPRDNDDNNDDNNMRDPTTWAPKVKTYFQAMGKHILMAKDSPEFPDAPQCDLSKAAPPIGMPPLPPLTPPIIPLPAI